MYWWSGGVVLYISKLITGQNLAVSFRPGLLFSRGKMPDAHLIGGSVDPRVSIYAAVKTKMSIPSRNQLQSPNPY
jgi:hypothetical protein